MRAVLATALVAGSIGIHATVASSAPPEAATSLVRVIETSDLGLTGLSGLAVSPGDGALLVTGSLDGVPSLVKLTPSEDVVDATAIAGVAPGTLTVDPTSGEAAVVTDDGVVSAPSAQLDNKTTDPVPLDTAGLEAPAGAAYNQSGALLLLDAANRSLVKVDGASATRVALKDVGGAELQGLAVNPADGLVYVGSPDEGRIYGVDNSGATKRVYGFVPEVSDPQAIAFAPSADTTDNPSNVSLFVAAESGVVEMSLQALALAITPEPSVLIQTIDTSTWSPPSPDASDVAYMPDVDRLQVVDGEVDEMPIFQNTNMWVSTRTGTVASTGVSSAFSDEPVGAAYRQSDRTLFVSDDNRNEITALRPGPDGRHGSGDDSRTTFSTIAFSDDPEGVAYDTSTGDLFVIDGITAEVARVDAGPNNTFGNSDDIITTFDVLVHGARDPEGITYNVATDTLVIVDQPSRAVYEMTKSGELLRIIDIRSVGPLAAAGITIAPGSARPDHASYYISDRGIDNGNDPNENDGRLYEIVADASGNNTPVVTSAVIDQQTPGTNETLSVSVVATDADGDGLSYLYQWRKNGVQIAGATEPTLDLSVPGNGDVGDAISVRVVAFDGLAQSAPRTSTQVTVLANSSPRFSQDLGDRLSQELDVVSLSAAATDPDGNVITYSTSGLPPGLGINAATGLISGTIAAGAGAGSPYATQVFASDGVTTPAQDAFLWSVGSTGTNTAPVISSVKIDQLTPGTADILTATIVATDAEHHPITYSYQWRKAGVAIAGATLPTLDLSVPGNGDIGDAISLRVVASDGLLSSAPRTSGQVTVVNGPPRFVQDTGDQSNIAGDTVSLAVTATDADGDAVTHTASGLPPGLTIDGTTGVISGIIATDADAASPYNVSVSATSGAHPATIDTFAWTVLPANTNRPPVLTAVNIGPASPRTNDTLTPTIDASDPDGDALTINYQWTKNGIDITGATGPTLDLAVAGNGNKGETIALRVTVSDPTHTITPATSNAVTIVNTVPAFSQDLANRSNPTGTPVSFSAGATDADGDPLTYSTTGLPSGVTINTATGLVSGTIAAGATTGSPYNTSISVSEGAAPDAVDTFVWTVTTPPHLPPAAPTALTTIVTTTGINLDWANNTETDLAGYRVYRGSSATGTFTRLNNTLLTTSQYTDSAAAQGTSFYRVVAVDTAGQESPFTATSAIRRILYRSDTSNSARNVTTMSISKPSSLSTNDLMIAAVNVRGTTSITPPSGWTTVRTNTTGTAMRQSVFYKRLTTSDLSTSSYLFRFGSQTDVTGIIVAYRGTSASSTVIASSGQANGSSTSVTTAGVDNTVAGALAVGFFGMPSNPTFTPPNGMIEQADVRQNGGGTSDRIALSAADSILPGTGATGSRTAIATTAATNIGQLIVMRPS